MAHSPTASTILAGTCPICTLCARLNPRLRNYVIFALGHMLRTDFLRALNGRLDEADAHALDPSEPYTSHMGEGALAERFWPQRRLSR
jgi:hypothetical protein